jgi:hypothetical protein
MYSLSSHNSVVVKAIYGFFAAALSNVWGPGKPDTKKACTRIHKLVLELADIRGRLAKSAANETLSAAERKLAETWGEEIKGLTEFIC